MNRKCGSQKLLLDAMDDRVPSGGCSPVFSWSPLPPRKVLGFTEKDKHNLLLDESVDLYPKCDVNVWMRSCEKEVVEPLEGDVTGNIPDWLTGCLLRNGPGSLKVGQDEFSHLFDSSALLHRFAIQDGKITYQCRFIESEVFMKNWSANRIVQTEFGSTSIPDPCHSIFQRIAAVFRADLSDNSMISIYPFGDELYAFGETPLIHKINAQTLATEDRVSIKEYVSIVHHTSHPHVLSNGTVYNLGMSITSKGPLNVIVCFPRCDNSDNSKNMFENAEIVAAIPARWPLNPSYMHTFGITENYFLIVEQPLSISVVGMVSAKLNNQPLAGCFRWYHDEYVQISVVDRKTGSLTHTFFAEAFFYLHIIHQYEINDHIVLDICIYKDPSMLDCMYIETMRSMQHNPNYAKMFRSRPARFVLPLNPESVNATVNKNLVKLKCKAQAFYLPDGRIYVKPEKLCNLGCETPRINYDKCLGRPYRYFYAISADVDADNPGTIIKVDTWTKKAKTWCEANVYPSEPIFVSSPDSKSEDDGVVLSSLVWGGEDTNHSGLLILDAKSFTEIARAEFKTPSAVPKCLHGWYLPQKANNKNNS